MAFKCEGIYDLTRPNDDYVDSVQVAEIVEHENYNTATSDNGNN